MHERGVEQVLQRHFGYSVQLSDIHISLEEESQAKPTRLSVVDGRRRLLENLCRGL